MIFEVPAYPLDQPSIIVSELKVPPPILICLLSSDNPTSAVIAAEGKPLDGSDSEYVCNLFCLFAKSPVVAISSPFFRTLDAFKLIVPGAKPSPESVLLVANNVIVPYINPHLHIDYLPNSYCNVDDSFYDITSLDLNKLSKDELLKIRKILKKYHQIKDERCVVDAIRNTKNKKVMRYKRERELLKGDVRND